MPKNIDTSDELGALIRDVCFTYVLTMELAIALCTNILYVLGAAFLAEIAIFIIFPDNVSLQYCVLGLIVLAMAFSAWKLLDNIRLFENLRSNMDISFVEEEKEDEN